MEALSQLRYHIVRRALISQSPSEQAVGPDLEQAVLHETSVSIFLGQLSGPLWAQSSHVSKRGRDLLRPTQPDSSLPPVHPAGIGLPCARHSPGAGKSAEKQKQSPVPWELAF